MPQKKLRAKDSLILLIPSYFLCEEFLDEGAGPDSLDFIVSDLHSLFFLFSIRLVNCLTLNFRIELLQFI